MTAFDDLRQSIDLFNPFGGANDVRGGRVITDNGRPLHVRDSHGAARRFSLTQQNWHHVPRPKFLFWVRFFGNYFQSLGASQTDRSNYIQGLSFLVKSVDKPSITLNTETLPQYNKKRVIYTGVNFEPISIRFHDDSNDDVLSFWKHYYRAHIGQGRVDKQVLSYSYDQTFDTVHGNNWGFAPATGGNPNMVSHYLSHIEIYQFFGGRVSQIDVVNPKITRFDHDNSDYADGNGTGEITMNIEYEGVLYPKSNEAITAMDSDAIESLLLDLGDYYQLPEILGNKDIFSWAPERVLQDATTALIQGRVPKARQILTGIVGETIPLRKDQWNDILEGAQGNIGQKLLTGVLSGRGFSFGNDESTELEGYRANYTTPGRVENASGQFNNRGIPVGDQTILGGLQRLIPSISSDRVQEARSLVDSSNGYAQQAYGDAVAVMSAEGGNRPGSYMERGDIGTRLTSAGMQAINSISKPTMAFANNLFGGSNDPTGRANRDF